MAARAARLDEHARQVLAASTTDTEPIEIFRIGVQATARALVQHALASADLARTAGSVSTATAAGETSPGKPAGDGGGAAGSARKVLPDPRTAVGCRIAMV